MTRIDFEEVARRARANANGGLNPASDSDTAELARLAGLTPFEYDRQRVEAANRLGVRQVTLDEQVRQLRSGDDAEFSAGLREVEPWPESVDGAALVEDIAKVIHRHVGLTRHQEDIIALWILHTYLLDAFRATPRLAITSPTPECGKSTLLSLLSRLTHRPLTASNITTAATFRAIEALWPTLLIDEADTFLRDNDELRGVMNSGHTRDTAYVIRTVGDNHQPRKFTTWAALAVALIGKLPATLESRSIHIEMKRLKPGEKVARLGLAQGNPHEHLARKAARWAADNLEIVRSAEPEMPKGFGNRRADNLWPLFAIADVVGGDWPRFARDAALKLDRPDAGQTYPIMLLADINDLFARYDVDRLSSRQIVEALAEREDRPWREFGTLGRPITANKIAHLLKGFNIGPRTMRDGRDTFKGYFATDFDDAVTRYLPD